MSVKLTEPSKAAVNLLNVLSFNQLLLIADVRPLPKKGVGRGVPGECTPCYDNGLPFKHPLNAFSCVDFRFAI